MTRPLLRMTSKGNKGTDIRKLCFEFQTDVFAAEREWQIDAASCAITLHLPSIVARR